MKPQHLHTCLIVSLLALTASRAAGQFDQLDLGKRYHDPMHGLSLRPPAAAEKQVTASATRLVNWQVRDRQTNAIAWTLTVQQIFQKTPTSQGALDTKTFAQWLRQDLSESKTFKIDELSVTQHAGHNAVQLSGQTVGMQKFWQQQLWVHAEKDRFLVFTVSGPLGMKNKLSQFASRIFQTIEVSDPQQYVKMRRENMLRGQKLLEEIDAATIADALAESPTWFLLKYKGQTVGWMYQVESQARFETHEGFRVTSYAGIELQGHPQRVMRRVLFSTPDGKIDRWNEYLEVGSDKERIVQAEDGLKRDDIFLIDISQDGKTRSIKDRGTKDALANYLPKVHEAIIYRLIDIKSPGYVGYVFGPYNRQSRRFDMRTIAVVGAERIDIDGQSIAATKISDQKHYDVDPSNVWVDSKGRILKIENEDGLVIQRAGRDEVVKNFPATLKTIARLSKD